MSQNFQNLIGAYKRYHEIHDFLKAASLAQWIIESGRGTSKLSVNHLNFGGLKYRPELKFLATPISYDAHDGNDSYCKFSSHDMFILGYWAFIKRSPYKGWDKMRTSEEYVVFIGTKYAQDPSYIKKVVASIPEARLLLGI